MKFPGADTSCTDLIEPFSTDAADGARPGRTDSLPASIRGRGTRRTRKCHGFTLLELMVTVVVIGIIAAIAYPSYLDQVRKSRRSEAKAALTDAATRMEKYFMDSKTYNTTDMTKLGYGSSPYTTTNGYYQISVDSANTSDTAYKLQAVAKGTQAQDSGCTTMWLDSLGQKTPNNCW